MKSLRLQWANLVAMVVPDVRLAIDQLAHHQLRSALTLLGMVFGVGAVIAMLAVSEGGRIEALKMIEGMGARNLIVKSVVPDETAIQDLRKHSAGLSIADAEAIQETMPFVERWAGMRSISPWALFSHEGQANASVWAVSPAFFDLSSLDAIEGRLFTADDDFRYAQVAVLGNSVARKLFPHGYAVGKRFKINHVWFRVVGVLHDRQLPGEEFQGQQVGGESERIYVPLQTGLRRMEVSAWQSELEELKVQMAPGLEPGLVSRAINHLLERRHGGQPDYELVIPARLLAQQRETQQIFTIVMSAVAGISLLVGGIGIMNIMLASVLERKSEIGLLRAVGARQADVVRQFLVETTVIALVGALAGVVLGVAIAYAIAGFSGWAVAWSVPVIILAVVVCVSIAVAFGVYPAMSAARLDPVAALQSD